MKDKSNKKVQDVTNCNNLVDKSISEDYYIADTYIRMAHIVTGRAYWAFSIMIIIVLMTGIVLFNHYLSHDQDFIKSSTILRKDITAMDSLFNEKQTEDTITNAEIQHVPFANHENEISREVRNNIIRNHLDSWYISIPLMGVKISVNDIMILMGGAFLVLIFWLYYCVRAENLTIGKILSLSQNKPINIQRYIFYGICFNNMFFPTTQRNKPYKSLSNNKKELKDEMEDIPKKGEKKSKKYDIEEAVFFLPAITMGICLLFHFLDIREITKEHNQSNIPSHYVRYEYSTENGFNQNSSTPDSLKTKYIHIQNTKIARFDFNGNIVFYSTPLYIAKLWILWYISLALFLLTLWVTVYILIYQSGTSNALYEFKKRFKHDDDCIKNITNHKDSLCKAKKITLLVQPVAKNIVFSKRYKYAKEKKEFVEKYSTENGYYFLTHTGDAKEKERIIEFLKSENLLKGIIGKDNVNEEKKRVKDFLKLNKTLLKESHDDEPLFSYEPFLNESIITTAVKRIRKLPEQFKSIITTAVKRIRKLPKRFSAFFIRRSKKTYGTEYFIFLKIINVDPLKKLEESV